MSNTTAASPLSGKTALITGASRGIGRETALVLAEAGARVALLSRDMSAMSQLIHELRPAPGGVAIAIDLSQPDVLQRLRTGWERLHDAPDIIVNNAGQFFIAPVEDTDPEELEKTLRVNVASPFAIVREFLAEMRRRGSGDVVTIGSIADRHVFAGNAAYAASKHGARAMHEVLREETRGSGVRATLVSPGPVDTALWDDVDPDSKPGFTPRAKMLDAAAVADAVLWVVTRPPSVNIDELRLSRA